MSSIYEQVGGAAAVEKAVDIFYRKMLVDDRVASYFDDVDMDRQRAKQMAFLTMVLGGPNNYAGQDMRRAHAHLVKRGLSDLHVDVVGSGPRLVLAAFVARKSWWGQTPSRACTERRTSS